MEFRYKLSATQSGAIANDSAAAAVQLTRTVNGTQEIIALGVQYLLTSAPNYTQGIVTFQYVSNAQPDTLRMVFASGSANNITAGTTLVVDAVTMAGTATAKRDAAVQLALSVYPTQSPDGRFTLAAPDQPALLLGALRVSDATGRVVHTQAAAPAAGPRTVDLHGQAPGVYVLRLDTPAGPLTRKLVVQ